MGSLIFNANEVFNVARQIERNGAAFYRGAAKTVTDQSLTELMLSLATMEDDHERTFAIMQSQLTDQEREKTLLDPHGEAFAFFQGMGDRYVFDMQADPGDFFKAHKDPRAILNKALQLEKDSIVFYEGIRSMVSGKRGADKIDGIIRQEMGHVSLLSSRLAQLG